MWSRNIVALKISHLLFTNDTLIFNRKRWADPDHLYYLCALFLSFEVESGLEINLAKSKLVHVGNVNNVDGLTIILGCGVSYLLLKYLGLPLGASFKVKSI
jgi:hypothetical protein